MNSQENIIIGFVAFIIAIIIIGIVFSPLIYLGIHGWHTETARGEHTGYITATEKGGILFTRNSVYLKTDTQSSQEDKYCVLDEAVYTDLQNTQRKKHL